MVKWKPVSGDFPQEEGRVGLIVTPAEEHAEKIRQILQIFAPNFDVFGFTMKRDRRNAIKV